VLYLYLNIDHENIISGSKLLQAKDINDELQADAYQGPGLSCHPERSTEHAEVLSKGNLLAELRESRLVR